MLAIPARRRRNRLTMTQADVLNLLRQKPQISYDEIAAYLCIDRNTAIQAVTRLESTRRLVKVHGRGKIPNRYILTDRLITWN